MGSTDIIFLPGSAVGRRGGPSGELTELSVVFLVGVSNLLEFGFTLNFEEPYVTFKSRFGGDRKPRGVARNCSGTGLESGPEFRRVSKTSAGPRIVPGGKGQPLCIFNVRRKRTLIDIHEHARVLVINTGALYIAML